MKSKISKYVKIAVSVILIFYLFYYLVDFRSLISIVYNVKIGYIGLSVVFFIMSVAAAAYRWEYVIRIQNKKMPFADSFREYFIGMFFNNFLPGSIGGDVVRIVGAAKVINSKEVALSSVFVERVIGLISLLTIGIMGFMFLGIESGPGYMSISLILLTTLILILAAVLNPRSNEAVCGLISDYLPAKIGETVTGYLKDFSGYSSSFLKLFYVFLISFGFKIFDGFFVYFVLKSVGIELTYAHAVALFSIINVIKMIPVSFNGLGLSAVSWVFILKSFGISENLAASVDFLTVSISLIISGYGGFLYFIGPKKEKGPD
ncbi:MAG TPA: lysylphosphatidylglycerol synthase transmembrane domain-containing protein [Clostridiales bacterium]|nr:lysylphosphatidylglycerol synthase transmembrane domain-containing protein [Clostridiales bacterium]HQP69731.1 lysylphosphatidylglycerol synthase transmembrane domain-containing protein [Clostridiales bacterium]